jgi:hypothetical protein
MNVIPATYNGIEYRSRTEARWAVFFDSLGIQFEYEREGYKTSCGWYVPDFWLCASQCWVEIKGSPQQYDTEAFHKLQGVCCDTQTFGVLFIGSPLHMDGKYVGQDYTDSTGGCSSDFATGIIDVVDGTVVLAIDDRRSDRWFATFSHEPIPRVEKGVARDMWSRRVADAAIQASRHRFW